MKALIATICLCLAPVIGATQSLQSQLELPPDTVVAVIDGVPITLSEVSAVALNLDAKRLFSLNQQLYAVRERALANLIGERLLAQRAKDAELTVDQIRRLPARRAGRRARRRPHGRCRAQAQRCHRSCEVAGTGPRSPSRPEARRCAPPPHRGTEARTQEGRQTDRDGPAASPAERCRCLNRSHEGQRSGRDCRVL